MEYPGAIYHVFNRGDRREPIFYDDADRRRFLETLSETCAIYRSVEYQTAMLYFVAGKLEVPYDALLSITKSRNHHEFRHW